MPSEGLPVSYTHLDVYKRQLFDLFDEKVGDDDPNTVSGWVMDKLGKMPENGDSFTDVYKRQLQDPSRKGSIFPRV